MVLASYGSVSKDFKHIAQMRNFFNKIKNGEISATRLDCYPVDSNLSVRLLEIIDDKFIKNDLTVPTKNIEVFYPSENYPSHVDDGGVSYFIPLESGFFLIDDVSYPIVPFVLYSFEDSRPHNSNFGAIMLK